MKNRCTPQRQRGMTLFVALIMLVLMLLMAIAGFNVGRQNTVIAGNMQQKMQTTSSASEVIEQVISSPHFSQSPGAPLGGTTNVAWLDINGDSTPDVKVTMTPQPCVKQSKILKDSVIKTDIVSIETLMLPLAADPSASAYQTLRLSRDRMRDCTSQNSGELKPVDDGITDSNSQCSDSLWEIAASAEDALTNANSTVVAGIKMRIATELADPTTYCTP